MEKKEDQVYTIEVAPTSTQNDQNDSGNVTETKFGVDNPAFDDKSENENNLKDTVISFNDPKSIERVAPEKPYAGMNKEDLLYFSQTKFWIRLRYVVIAILGLAWLGLLAAIIALTIVWPRCKKELETEWWQSSRIYSIYVPTFYDSNNDGIGDLKGIENKLDYVKDLHMSAIHLAALYDSGTANSVDFGYEVRDHKLIASQLGTMEDFRSLVNATHEKDMKIIIDLIPGHTGTEHTWFQQSQTPNSPFENYYIWKDCTPPTTLPNNWLSVYNGPAWIQDATRNQCYLRQLRESQPQLNLRIKSVRDEIESIMDYWLAEGVDGFKVIDSTFLFVDNEYRDEPPSTGSGYDSLNHIYTRAQPEVYNLISEWRYKLDQKYNRANRKVLITDADEELSKLIPYYNYLGRNGSQVPMNMPFAKLNEPCDGLCVRNNVRSWTTNTPADCFPNWLTGTQDMTRLATRSQDNSKAYNLIKLTLPGISMFYYGEEIGMVAGTDSNVDPTPLRRDRFRTPMQWDATLPNMGFSNATNIPIAALNNGIDTSDSNAELKLVRTVAKLKSNEKSLQYGKFELITNINENIVAFLRRLNGNDCFLIVANFGSTNRRENLSNKHNRIPSKANVVANIGQGSSYPIDDDKDIKLNSVSIKAGEAIVFKWEYERSMKDKDDK